MGIQAKFNMDAIRKYAHSKKPEFEKATLEAYKMACIKMVDRAKRTNTYQDQTHKLRSSIGCVLYFNGKEVFNYFESTGGEKGGEGVQEGLVYARSIVKSAKTKGIVAVVVAGADYARYVESKGYDVLKGSTQRFADDLKVEFNNVKNEFKKHIKSKSGL